MISKMLLVVSIYVVFLVELEVSDDYIVDWLIKERCLSFVDYWSWLVVCLLFYGVLGYGKVCCIVDYL